MSWENNVRKVVPYVPGEQPKAEKMITTLMGDKVEGRKEFLAKYANFNKRDTFMDKVEKTGKKENDNGEN